MGETDDLFAGVEDGDDLQLTLAGHDESPYFRVVEIRAGGNVLLRGRETHAQILVERDTGKSYSAPDGFAEGYLGRVAGVQPAPDPTA